MNIRILSYNVHWGLSAFKRVDVTTRLTGFIHSTHADVILLQELWLPKGSLEYVMVETLRESWPHQVCVATAVLSEGEQGNGILSRHPITSSEQIDISFEGNQPRSFLHARLWLETEQKSVSIICTHFGLDRRERMFQAEKLCAYIRNKISEGEALILGGDFNDWRGTMTPYFTRELGIKEVFQQLTGRHARSFPAICPIFPLDRLYARGLAPLRSEVLGRTAWRGSSDHLALAAEFKL